MNEPLDRPKVTAEHLARGLAFPDRCYTEVSRSGEAQPCHKPAVAARLGDAEDEWPYPVCGYHARTTGMVPLSELYASRAEKDRLAAEVDRLAAELAEAQQQAVVTFLNEQSVRYRKHSALALEEDYDLASELFGFDARAALGMKATT